MRIQPRLCLRALTLTLPVIALLGFLEFHSPTLATADGYFHSRVAWLLGRVGLFRDNFPWLPFTALADHWYDPELGWHVLAIPFVVHDPLLGAKVFSVLQAAICVLSIHLIASRWGLRSSYALAVFCVLGSHIFTIRILSFRPQTLAVTAFLWGLVAIVEARAVWVVAIAATLTWMHDSFFLLVLAAVGHSLYRLALSLWGENPEAAGPGVAGLLAMPAAALSGCVIGLVIHPHFPRTFTSLVWHVGMVFDPTDVGGEWLPAETWELVVASAPVVALIAVAFLVTVGGFAPRVRPFPTGIVGLATVAFLLMGTRWTRMAEYWVPLGVLWAGCVLGDLESSRDEQEPAIGRATRWLAKALGVAIGIGSVIYFSVHLPAILADLARKKLDGFVPVVEYARRNLGHREVVFHSYWGDFPQLFFLDLDHQYISGLSPAFLQSHSPDLGRLLTALKNGLVPCPSIAIRHRFSSRLALVNTLYDSPLAERARRDPLLEPVRVDELHVLFRMRAEPVLPLVMRGAWFLEGASARAGRVEAIQGDSLGFAAGVPGAELDLPLPVPADGPTRLWTDLAFAPDGDARIELKLDGRSVMTCSPDELRRGVRIQAGNPGGHTLTLGLAGAAAWPVRMVIRSVGLDGWRSP